MQLPPGRFVLLLIALMSNGCGGDDGDGVDGGIGGDGGNGGVDAASCDPVATWTPVDTDGPDGESVLQCLSRLAGSNTDDRIPEDQLYAITTFGGPGDEQPVACSGQPDADGTWYYAANAHRFECGATYRLVDSARTTCVVVRVADIGPHICVEEAAAMPIWDVSPLAADTLVGETSVGWSEGKLVVGAQVSTQTPLGPCDDLAMPPTGAGFIGGPCTRDADCGFAQGRCETATDGYPGGHCTADCIDTCPDQVGAFALTACEPGQSGNRCVSQCDFTLFTSGCRDGYSCIPRLADPGATRVCEPVACF